MTAIASLPLDTFALLVCGAFFALALAGAIVAELAAMRERRRTERRFRSIFGKDW